MHGFLEVQLHCGGAKFTTARKCLGPLCRYGVWALSVWPWTREPTMPTACRSDATSQLATLGVRVEAYST